MALIETHAPEPSEAPDLSAFVGKDDAGKDRLELLVRGARCAGCLGKIERTAAAVPGVAASRFNLTTGKLTVTLAAKLPAEPAAVIKALDGAGYPATPYDPGEAALRHDREGRDLAIALGVAGFGAGNVMMFSVPVWAGLFGQELSPATRELMYWLCAIVATPCALYAGMTFFRSAFESLRRGKANMDVPITIGVLLTLGVSFSETLQHGAHAYFDAAVTLLFLLLIGRYLDHHLRARARSAARDLLALQAPIATRLDGDNREHGVPVAEVMPGDRLAVAPGDRIPVDALVAAGVSDIDNALITGETASVRAEPGALVHAGALNLSGRLILRATARSEDSTVAAIARLMEAGAQSRSAYVRLADRAAAIYVPVVHALAAATFVGGWILGLGPHEALLRAAAVLIVTCPCALGLAVPAVQVAACGRLFRHGVLVKSGAALERLAEVNHVVLDKTGVLTEGRPTPLEVPPRLLAQVAPLARASRHPLCKALAEAAGPGPVATDVVEHPGLGIEGVIDGRKARLGRAQWMNIDAHSPGTEMWFAFEGETRFRLAFADRLRPGAAATVAALKARGLSVEILSGDVEAAVRAAAEAVGISQWTSGLTPQEKAGAVDLRGGTGQKVLMIGDGLNDAAALARAHASMAPGAAVDASQNAADMVFSGESLDGVVEAIDVARAARRRALENFAFSALYNMVAAPAAIFGLINPFVAAIAMSGSSLVVTLNALRMTLGGRRAR
jgi:Cu2+-exporting ATPase